MRKSPYTLSQPFEYFQAQSNLRPGMLRTYTYAVQHFSGSPRASAARPIA